MNVAWKIGITLLAASLFGCSDPGASGGVSNLLSLAEDYPAFARLDNLEGANHGVIRARLAELNLLEHRVLGAAAPNNTFRFVLFLHACEVDSSIQWSNMTLSGEPDPYLRYDCPTAANSFAQAVNTPPAGAFLMQVDTHRQQTVAYIKCFVTHEYDPGTCAMWGGAQQQVYELYRETGDVILSGFGDQCRVGVDPNCYP